MINTKVEQWVFLGLVLAISLAFVRLLLPYYGAVFWAVVLAILFSPLQRALLRRTGNRATLSALVTTVVTLLVAVLPMSLIAGLLVQEGAAVYGRLQAGHFDISGLLNHVKDSLPSFVQARINKLNLADTQKIQESLIDYARQGSQFLATKAFSFGQGTAEFFIGFGVMLYLLFFLIRDGEKLLASVREAIPLRHAHKALLFDKFTRVVQATVKGNIVVAITQGALGGMIFWVLGVPSALLWGVLMAFLSLLPAVGAGLVWAPVAAYFLCVGDFWKGIILIAFCVGVIGLVDNILRPILVGKDTKLPDYLVLISTLGGMSLFGLNGFVLGPVIAALFVASWSMFADTVSTEKS